MRSIVRVTLIAAKGRGRGVVVLSVAKDPFETRSALLGAQGSFVAGAPQDDGGVLRRWRSSG